MILGFVILVILQFLLLILIGLILIRKPKTPIHWKHFKVDKSGKRTIYFMVDDKECKSPWNPGKCLPSKRFKK